MKRIDIERTLLDPAALKRLTENAGIPGSSISTGATSSNPARKVRGAGQTPLAILAKPEDIKATDRTHIRRRGILANIGKFYPELAHESASKVLTVLTEEYQKHPTEDGQYLIQDAINRITHVGELDEGTKRVVHKAIEVLTSVKLPGQSDAQDKDSIFSNLYEHPDFRGRSMFAYLGPDSIYQAVQTSYLELVGLNDRISSLTLDTGRGVFRGDVILFQDDRFFGRFTGIRTNTVPTQQVSASYVGDFINDRTSSLLLVRRFDHEDLHTLGDPVSKALIGSVIAGVEKIRELRGEPVFTWDMWPTGGDSHPYDPDKRFVQIKVPVVIDVPHWFDYDAEIWLWFYLYIGDGRLRGYLAYYGAEVESGLMSQNVLDGIMEALPGKVGEIETLLATTLGTINGSRRFPFSGPFSDVYLLPGDQSLFTGVSMEGNVADNVTIAVVRRQERVPNTLVTLV